MKNEKEKTQRLSFKPKSVSTFNELIVFTDENLLVK